MIISKLNENQLFKNLDFKFKIFGRYNKDLLRIIVKKLDIEDLIYLGDFISQEKVFEEVYKSDLAVHIGENLNYPTIAFKVWDYLSCGKKLIYLGREDSYTAKFLLKKNIGFTIPINDLSKGLKTFENILDGILNESINLNIEEKKIENFSWSKRIKSLGQHIKENLNLDQKF